MALEVNNLPANEEMQEMRIGSLDWKISWSREWQLTLVFSPGESHGQRILEGYSPWWERSRPPVRLDLAGGVFNVECGVLKGDWRTQIIKKCGEESS